MSNFLSPAKPDSRSGKTLWFGTILNGVVVLVYLVSYIYLVIKTGEPIQIDWLNVSVICGVIQGFTTAPYVANRMTFKEPHQERTTATSSSEKTVTSNG